MSHPKSKKRLWPLLVALAALLILLPGCATRPEYVRELPPVELLRNCPAPDVKVETNGELASTLRGYIDALAQCNIDKEALREWAKD